MTVADKIPVWLDCDPGNDDAFAILLLTCLPQFKLVGVSTCFGNAPLESTTRNTLAVLETLKFSQDEIKVYQGSSDPLEGSATYALDVHGIHGISGVDVSKPSAISVSTDVTYLQAIKREAEKYRGDLCFVSIGSLTNLAKLTQEYPEIRSLFHRVSIMGGAFNGLANITDYSEFNIYADAKAASIVLNDPILLPKMILLPLNITHTAIVTKDVQAMICNDTNKSSSIRKIFYDISEGFRKTYQEFRQFETGPPIHDPVAVAALLGNLGYNEELDFIFKRGTVEVVTSGSHKGETIFNGEDPQSNEDLQVAESMNSSKFWNLISEAFQMADKRERIH